MIDTRCNSVFELQQTDVRNLIGVYNESIHEVRNQLVEGEHKIAIFVVPDNEWILFIFTNERIITVDYEQKNNIFTPIEHYYSSLPFSNVTSFALQPPDHMQLLISCKLVLTFQTGFTATFNIRGEANVKDIIRAIAECTSATH